MKGIILAGGHGTRLRPLTLSVSKHLLPVYDAPLIYYPLSTLLLAGIRDILIIVAPDALAPYQAMLGDGSDVGISLTYAVQARPDGVAGALVLGAEFVGHEGVTLILGDNLFHGAALTESLRTVASDPVGATIFGYRVADTRAYGVVDLDPDGRAVAIEEKPPRDGPGLAVPGLYSYDNAAMAIARAVVPSARGELEITDVNREYLRRGRLKVQVLGPDVTWIDAGTPDSLLDASSYVRGMREERDDSFGAIHAVAFELGLIDGVTLARHAAAFRGSLYGARLERLAARPAA